MLIIRSKPRTPFYRKIVWANGWHFIFDNRNKWIVVGKRFPTMKKYRYIRFLFLTFLMSRARVNKPDCDIDLRLTYGRRKETPEDKAWHARVTGKA